MSDLLDLWDYRRRVSDIYADVRKRGAGSETWERWKSRRHDLFAYHPQTPVEDTSTFEGLDYFSYDPSWRVEGVVTPLDAEVRAVGHSSEGVTRFSPFGRVEFTLQGRDLSLTLLWLEAYGGGVFLPFRDLTNASTTYGGGRYLLDTVKGADLGGVGAHIVLDFNYSYHPSCVQSPKWSCPLAPPENRLDIAIEAGERL